MKTTALLVFAMTLPVFAGPSAKEVVAPAQAPCLYTWFAGGSVGYLTEFEEAMYNVHLGTDTCWNVGGWNVSLFAEVGYTEKDESWSGNPQSETKFLAAPAYMSAPLDGESFGLGGLEDALSNIASNTPYGTSYDLNIIPITLNAKFERNLTGNLNAYFGGGLGMARVSLDVDAGVFGDFSDDDWVFTAQIFAGLNYNVTQSFEVYGGARWIYFDDAGLSDNGSSFNLDLKDDFLFELGGRFNF